MLVCHSNSGDVATVPMKLERAKKTAWRAEAGGERGFVISCPNCTCVECTAISDSLSASLFVKCGGTGLPLHKILLSKMMRLAMRALSTAACTCKGLPAVRGLAGLHAGAGSARPRSTVHWTRPTPRLLYTTSFAASAEPEPPSPSGDGFEEVPFSRELVNTVTITGNLGTDVELKHYENSTKSATIPLAIGRRDRPPTW